MAETMAGSQGWIGSSPPRVDGMAKVVGSAKYTADLKFEGALHAAVIRSQVPRGRLLGIDLDPTFDWSDVTVVMAEELERNVVAEIELDLPILVESEIRHAYEPIALLACADPAKLERSTRHVHVRVQELPAVLSIEQALEAKEILLAPDNVMKRYQVKLGDAPKAIEGCEVVVRGTYRVGHQEHLYLEPQAIVAWWDDQGVHVTGSIQCPYYVHKALMHGLLLPTEKVEVIQAVTGGAFGGKEDYPSVIALQTALLSRKAGGRPVRLVFERKDDIEATTKRHPARVEITSGSDRDGKLRAVQINVVMDAGAYVTMTPVVLSRGTLHACGAYKWQDVLVDACAVVTNTPPNGAFRGFGAPQTIFAIERHLDAIAVEIGMDPLELRKKNLLEIGSVMPTGQVLQSSVGVAECVRITEAESGYAHKRTAYGRDGERVGRKARGIGASVFLHGAGFTGSGEERLKGVIAVDLLQGGRFRVRSSSTDMGQGTETVFQQIAATAAELPFESIEVAVPHTGRVPDSGPTVASRTVMIVGSVLDLAARELAGRVRSEMKSSGLGFAAAADRLLQVEKTVTVSRQYAPPPGVSFDDKTYTGTAYGAYAWSCDIAEVEVDLDTFEIKVIGFWSATDVGRAVHPVMCAGQIEGGSLQALGWALWEEVLWKDGRIINPRMTTYIVPTALDAPPMMTALVEEPYAYGPGGAKGIGELPMDGGAPAIAAAVEHATGIVFRSLPITPERILDARVAMQAKEVRS
jgi:CO/xanthine dehydrogenase Mo-binding subunit